MKEAFFKAARFYRRHGLKRFLVHLYRTLFNVEIDYEKWLKNITPGKSQFEAQRRELFARNILFSIVCETFTFTREQLEALEGQTYMNWEIIKESSQDCLNRNTGTISSEIATALNDVVSQTKGEYVIFLRRGSIPSPDALYEFARVIETSGNVGVIYSDEDAIEENGRHCSPKLKPDFNLDMLRSTDYISSMFAVSRESFNNAGGFSQGAGEAVFYELLLKLYEGNPVIFHVPKILNHDSSIRSDDDRSLALNDHVEVLKHHYARTGIAATVNIEKCGMLRTRYEIHGSPLVSIIIPNKDHVEDLSKCLDSIFEKSAYRNFEVLIIENNSSLGSTFEYYDEVVEKHENVRVIEWVGEFNYSAINNFGAKHAKGDYLLLLNNDTELLDGDSITELLRHSMRPEIGVVGAKLLYGDDTVQHAGVIIGMGGIAGHVFTGLPDDECGYMCRAECTQNYSAVTAACMMTKKSVFDSVGGFSEDLKVAFNDIDYCLKVRESGKLLVYSPYARLYHHESKSRGQEDTKAKVRRFNQEISSFRNKWPDILINGDPCYNLNLTLEKSDFSLRE